MSGKYPQDSGWWEATLFRLSGEENQPIRQLIAGSPALPPTAFEALLHDKDLDVLLELSQNPAFPRHLVPQLLRHPDSRDVLDEDFYDGVAHHPDLTPNDLESLMENASDLGQEWAVVHANADWSTVSAFLREYRGTLDGYRMGTLIERFPPHEHSKVWNEIWNRFADSVTRPLLECETTPHELLLDIARNLHAEASRQSGWEYLHEVTEELFRHPNVDAEVFGVLINHWVFQEQDYDHDLRCLRIISQHPRATVEQQQEAGHLISKADAWGPKGLDE
ncbi:hypothetical protein Q0M94_25975 (plasmid) [Deinococcus radiomollis]|uniref:hypothetical protein n=1 Tax=Deinococcus radiomollis TaxID=468916 RepID=UPI00389193C9